MLSCAQPKPYYDAEQLCIEAGPPLDRERCFIACTDLDKISDEGGDWVRSCADACYRTHCKKAWMVNKNDSSGRWVMCSRSSDAAKNACRQQGWDGT